MSIKQLFAPDFYVCDWQDEIGEGRFAVIAACRDSANVIARQDLAEAGVDGVVLYRIRRPGPIERWRAA